MVLLELALLGIRNFQQITRFEFTPGLNLVHGSNGSGKTTLRDAILLSFFGQNQEQPSTLIHSSSRSTCQTAITFKTKNGEVYRLANDFVKNIAILSRHDPAMQKFLPIEKRRDNVHQWFQQQCGGLLGQRVSHYFSLDRSRLPSFQVKHGISQQTEFPPAPGELLEPAPPETVAEFVRPSDPIAKQKRLQELRTMADKAEEFFQLEEQLSDAKSHVAILKRKLADLNKLDQELEQTQEKAKKFGEIEGTAEQLEELVDEFEAKLVERNREYNTLEEDRSLLEHQLNMIPTDPIYKNKLFIAGAVSTALSFGMGLFLTLPGLYQHLYLLVLLVGLGLTAASVLVDMRWNSRKKLLEEKLHNKLKNVELLEARFRRENLKFFDLMKKTNTDSVEAFKEKLKAYDFISGSRQRLLEERERLLEGKELQSLQAQYDENLGRIQEMNHKIKGYQGVPLDLLSLREEIRILENEVASTLGGKQQAIRQTGVVGQTIPTQQNQALPTRQNGHQNSIHELIRDPLVNQNQLLNAAREIFKRVSLGTYLDFTLDESSQIHLLHNGSSTPVSIETLSPGTLDQVFLSFYLALLLNLSLDYQFPVLLDDPLVSLDPKRQEVVLEILRQISEKRQVVLLSCQPYPPKEGENQIRLP
jgi:DNA repair exonuclease SbcCD ATPase subunit